MELESEEIRTSDDHVYVKKVQTPSDKFAKIFNKISSQRRSNTIQEIKELTSLLQEAIEELSE